MNNIDFKNLKVVLVAEFLTQLGGAERVLDALLELFPDAPVYTLVWDKERTQHKYDKFDVRTSFIQKLPQGVKNYKWYLPLMPSAIEVLDLSDYDVIISSSSAMIKGVKTKKNQIHICYCHTPTRYLWSSQDEYLKTAPIPGIIRPIMPLAVSYLKKWDLKASKRPDFYIANAHFIQERIKKYYNRDSDVIYPPVECDKFKIDQNIGDYYLLLARLEPYKKADLVIDAFKQMPDKKLVVVGSGSKKEELEKMVGPNVKFAGRVTDEELSRYYSQCLAFIHPQEEDFGITAVEAQAAGRPVIAYGKGGALESVVEGVTGEFFYPQTIEALVKTIKNFVPSKYNPQKIREHAEKFSKAVFKKKILEYIINKLKVRKVESL